MTTGYDNESDEDEAPRPPQRPPSNQPSYNPMPSPYGYSGHRNPVFGFR